MSFEHLKLSKRLQGSMIELGFTRPTEFQTRTLSRIIGGHSIVGIAPEGAGKTTAYILGALMRLKPSDDEAPKILVLAPDEERIEHIVDQFYAISRNKNLHIMGLKASGSMEDEINELVLGVDIVVATPNRAPAVYLKLGLNLNRIQLVIIDDAEELIKQGVQTRVRELAQSCGKVQYLVFGTVETDKLHQMIDVFMPHATWIEVEELDDEGVETYEQLLYQVPNFTTKINLLNLLMQDEDVFDKVVVFVNTMATARKLQESIYGKAGEIEILGQPSSLDTGIQHIEDFNLSPRCRILIVCNEGTTLTHVSGIPFMIHFEIPEEKELFIQRVTRISQEEIFALTFATDIELAELRKIEQQLGQKLPVAELPEDLIIYKPNTANSNTEEIDESRGGAFHQKKESNNKSYNYGGGEKAKMTKKNKKR